MHGQTEQEPAVSVLLIKGNAHALAVVVGELPAGLLFGVGGQIPDDPFTAGAEILFRDLKTDLAALQGLLQVGGQIAQILACLTELCRLDDDFGAEIRAVVKEIILAHGGMTGGLYCQRTVDACRVQLQRLVNNVFVASAVAVMLAAEVFFDKALQAA